MKMFYAAGGGFGHLRRVQRFISQTQTGDYRVISNNPVARLLFECENVLTLLGDSPAQWSEQVSRFIQEWNPEALFIDTFPNGLLGELNAEVITAPVNYLARRLKWAAYQPLLTDEKQFHFETVYRFECLEQEHQKFGATHARKFIEFKLSRDLAQAKTEQGMFDGRLWLVMHTSQAEEVESLVEDAIDLAERESNRPVIGLYSNIQLQGKPIVQIDHRQFSQALSSAERVFCGGGFNTLFELQPYRHKVRAVPFPRRFDDQAWRIRNFYHTT